jgi:predicted RNase H-like HicB family nuclease
METYTYPITVEREGRKYYAYSENFLGVYGLGKTIEEAKSGILEAMRLYIHECRIRIGVSLVREPCMPRPFPSQFSPQRNPSQ